MALTANAAGDGFEAEAEAGDWVGGGGEEGADTGLELGIGPRGGIELFGWDRSLNRERKRTVDGPGPEP